MFHLWTFNILWISVAAYYNKVMLLANNEL